jgi:hypothetical protein
MQTCRQTDMMKQIVDFCIFASMPKNGLGLDQLLLKQYIQITCALLYKYGDSYIIM